MNFIWDKLTECQQTIIKLFDQYAEEFDEPGLSQFNQSDGAWINRVWKNQHIRRAHIDVVDARHTKGLWMMHVCVFPNFDNDSPIYGFDVIAGARKITGAFHDFSPTVTLDHELTQEFYASVEDFEPSKARKLPQWAQNIFTSHMLAAGNVKTQEEEQAIIDIAVTNLEVYLQEVVKHSVHSNQRDKIIQAQDYYCYNQQQNPHTPRVMKSLGLPEAQVDTFCRDMLFPMTPNTDINCNNS